MFRHLSPDYESDTIAVWRKIVEPNCVVWDIGSNLGLYTILSGKQVGSSGEVHAFEPSPVAHRVATEHIRLNGLQGVCKVSQVAVSETDGGVLPFSIVDEGGFDPTNRLGNSSGKTIEVPAITLDGLLARSKRGPDYVKMDIEGAEVFALRGSSELMTKQRPIILLAVHPMFLPEFSCDANEIASMIAERSYTSVQMNGVSMPPIEYSEYLLIPNEKLTKCRDLLGWKN